MPAGNSLPRVAQRGLWSRTQSINVRARTRPRRLVWHLVLVWAWSSLERPETMWLLGADRQRETPWGAAAWRRLLAVSAVDGDGYRAQKELLDPN